MRQSPSILRVVVAASMGVASTAALATPAINSILTNYSALGTPTSLTLAGSGFCSTASGNCATKPTVTVGGTALTVSAATAASVTATFVAAPPDGDYTLILTAGTTGSVSFGLTISPPGAAGATGAKGATGATGPTGAAGAKGATGSTGVTGATGAAGVSMTVGTTTSGAAGTNAAVTNSGTSASPVLNFTVPRGATGVSGPTGATGAAGNNGGLGPVGATGATGPTGATGVAGAVGSIGGQGGTGATGATGAGFSYNGTWNSAIRYAASSIVTYGGSSYVAIQANQAVVPANDVASNNGLNWNLFAAGGATGAAGATGPTGSTGVGIAGPAGQPGAPGPTGPIGPQGAQGNAGPPGPQGVQGIPGVNGATGATGLTGPSGVSATALAPRGAWDSAFTYKSGDIVVQTTMLNGSAYLCQFIAAIASTGSDPVANSNPLSPNSTWMAVDPQCRSAAVLSVGGTLAGLPAGQSISLTLTPSVGAPETITVSNNGTYAFNSSLPYGTTYTVQISAQPSGETCGISNGVGVATLTNISNVAAGCNVRVVGLSILAGQPDAGFGYVDGPASVARFYYPTAMTADAVGNLYVADSNNAVRKVDTAGNVTTLAGDGNPYSCNSTAGVGAAASFCSPYQIAVQSNGTVWSLDSNGALWKIDATGYASPVAITGTVAVAAFNDTVYVAGSTLELKQLLLGGTSVIAHLGSFPTGLTTDAVGNIYAAEQRVIERFSPTGVSTIVAGDPNASGTQDGPFGSARFTSITGITVTNDGTLYVIDAGNLRRVSAAGDVLTLSVYSTQVDYPDGPINQARFFSPTAISHDSSGNVYIADAVNIRRLSVTGEVTTYSGAKNPFGWRDGAGNSAKFQQSIRAAAVDRTGNVYIADTFNQAIRRVSPSGEVSTVAGIPTVIGYVDGRSNIATFNYPTGIACDSIGNIFVTDQRNYAVRKIDARGNVTTFAGGLAGSTILDGPVENAGFKNPWAIAIGNRNEIYVGDAFGVRKIENGFVTTIPGTESLRYIRGLAVANDGTVYFSDFDRVYAIATDGTVSLLAGGNYVPYQPVDGIGTTATFGYIRGLAVGIDGNIYVSEVTSGIIRRVTPNGTVTTVAGSNSMPWVGKFGPLPGKILMPSGIASVPDGNNLSFLVPDGLEGLIIRINLP